MDKLCFRWGVSAALGICFAVLAYAACTEAELLSGDDTQSTPNDWLFDSYHKEFEEPTVSECEAVKRPGVIYRFYFSRSWERVEGPYLPEAGHKMAMLKLEARLPPSYGDLADIPGIGGPTTSWSYHGTFKIVKKWKTEDGLSSVEREIPIERFCEILARVGYTEFFALALAGPLEDTLLDTARFPLGSYGPAVYAERIMGSDVLRIRRYAACSLPCTGLHQVLTEEFEAEPIGTSETEGGSREANKPVQATSAKAAEPDL